MSTQYTQVQKIKWPLYIIGFASMVLLFLPIAQAKAVSYFGGMRLMTLSCTCTNNQLIYIRNYAKGGVLALVYDGTSKLYSNSNIYGTYLLGSYGPGGECQVGAVPDCVTIQSDGKFNSSPGTGTS